MRHRLMLSGAAVALASVLWQSADHASAQPVVAERGKPEMIAARTSSHPRPRDIEHKDTAPSAARPDVPKKAAQWSREDIDAARARCTVLLKGRDVVAIAAEPIKAGDCGTPAPVQLISIGAMPQVALSPPPLVTCEVAAALAGWLETEVQPAARELLGGPVIRLEVMSAYSCRNAYARLKTKLSEHGRANALDIAIFVTERGEIAHLRSDWGETGRDVEARIAAARKAPPENPQKAPPTEGESDTATSLAAAGKNRLEDSIAAATRPAATLPGLGLANTSPALSLGPPSQLGGPRPPRVAEAPPRQRFLRRIHAAACRHFGTVLGPEVNEAHRNHFHLDMAERPVKRICE